MSKIKKITLPDNNTYDIDLPDNNVTKLNTIYNVFSPSTIAGTSTSGSVLSARWYVSGVEGNTAPYDGMKLAIKIPSTLGVATGGVILSLNGNTAADYHPIVLNASTVLSNQFPAGAIKIFIYDASASATCYKTSGTSSSVTGVWKAEGDYDADTYQSIKSLNTTATSAQSTNSSEAISGSGTITLHKVSKTGSYDDLNNKPTIPTVNNATLTIQKNGTTVNTFTANASSNVTANITVPTKTSDITNDSGFLTSSSNINESKIIQNTYNTSGDVNQYDRLLVPQNSSNRTAFIEASAVTIEYSVDGGTTWVDYGADDAKKKTLFAMTGGTQVYIGSNNSNFLNSATLTSSNQSNFLTRVIITYPSDKYCQLDKFYCNKSGPHGTQVKLEYTTYGAQTTWNDWRDWTGVSGWTGPNMMTLTNHSAFGSNSSGHIYAIKLTFRYNGTIDSNYTSQCASVGDFRFFGITAWSGGALLDTPYTWNYNGDMFAKLGHKKQSLGTGSCYWNDVYGTTYYENGTALSSKYVPQTRTVNGKALSSNVSLVHSDIGNGYLNIGDGAYYQQFRTASSWHSGFYYHTTGDEAMVFGNENTRTSWIFANTNPSNRADWTTLTPALQIKNGKVAINKLIANSTQGAYELDVNGTINGTTIYENGTTLANTYLGKTAKAADSDKLNGQAAAYYLNYNNLSNKPTLGTAAAKDYTTSVTSGSSDLVTSGAVWTAIDNLPEPMVFKGTLGTGGTITSLPTASSSNEGYTYKVIVDGTYASTSAKVGDVFISNGSAWVLIPSGDDTTNDTWRGINVNGTALLGNGISSGAVNFKNGTNVTITGSGSDVTISTAPKSVNLTPANLTQQETITLTQTQYNDATGDADCVVNLTFAGTNTTQIITLKRTVVGTDENNRKVAVFSTVFTDGDGNSSSTMDVAVSQPSAGTYNAVFAPYNLATKGYVNTFPYTVTDNILDGSRVWNSTDSHFEVKYAPYSSQQSKLSFDTSSTAPTRTDRLNLNGYLYATRLYSNGSQVLTAESDTLSSVTGRGASTTNTITVSNSSYNSVISPSQIKVGYSSDYPNYIALNYDGTITNKNPGGTYTLSLPSANGTLSIVTANPGSGSTTLTTVTINGTNYSVGGVEIIDLR